MLCLVGALALAGSWTAATPLDEEPTVLPANAALRIEVRRGGVPSVSDDRGPVPVVAHRGAFVVEAAPTTRTLEIIPPVGASIRLRQSTRQGAATAWYAYDAAARRAIRRGAAVPTPPWGGERLRARIQLRSEAVTDRRVLELGIVHDLDAVRPRLDHAHRARAPVQGAVQVRGPGSAEVRTRPTLDEGERYARYGIEVFLDGDAVAAEEVFSMGAARSVRVPVPPGRHPLRVDVSAPALVEVQTSRWRSEADHRRFSRLARHLPAGAADRAEALWLLGRRAEAVVAFRALVHGPADGLARARLVALTDDPRELAELASTPPAHPVAAEVWAQAVVARWAELPDDVVERAILAAADPDPVATAAWLDARSAVRPRGAQVLHRTVARIPQDYRDFQRTSRAIPRTTRWSLVAPTPEALPASVEVVPDPPGLAIVRVASGDRVELQVPPPLSGRVPIVELFAPGRARFDLAGQTWEGTGDLRIAIPPGSAPLTVHDGEIHVIDEHLVPGATPVYTRPRWRLPATWTLPDEGARADLRVWLDSPDPVLVAFDDGRAYRMAPDSAGVIDVPAGPYATSVTVTGTGAAALMMRRPLDDADTGAMPSPGVADIEAALVELDVLSRQIDAGESGARLERAVLLDALAQVSLARRDLAVALEDPAQRSRAIDLVDLVGRRLRTAPIPGPASPEAALAQVHAPAPVDTDARSLRTAAETWDRPHLWAALAEALEADQPVEAMLHAVRAGAAGADVVTRIAARLTLDPIAYVDRSGGLRRIRVQPSGAAPDGEPGPVWRRVREAMLAAPWSLSESAVVRRGASDVAIADGSAFDVDVFCRTEDGPPDSCALEVRFDRQIHQITLGDGESGSVALIGRNARHEIEVTGLEPWQAAVVRIHADGRVLVPGGIRTALHVSRGRPSRVTVSPDTVLRVDVLAGSVQVAAQGRRVAVAAPDSAWIPLLPDADGDVEVSGDGDVLLWQGRVRPAAEVDLEAGADDVSPDLFDVLARFEPPPEPSLRLPERAGSVRVRVQGARERLSAPTEPWETVETSASWFRGSSRGWTWLDAWGRGPRWAGGAAIEGGLRARRSWVALRAETGVSRGVAADAWSASARVDGRHDVVLTPDVRLRGDARLRGTLASPRPAGTVDPKVWSLYRKEQPVSLSIQVSVVARPFTDLRLQPYVRASADTGAPLRSLGVGARGALLVGRRTVVTADADFGLDEGDATPDFRGNAAVHHALWTGRGTRLAAFARGGVSNTIPIGAGGIEVLWTFDRGLRDLPPDFEWFRTARDLP